MQLWPFIPESDMKETLEWKTEVLRSQNGEQRIALRFFPRTTLLMDYILESHEYVKSSLLAKNFSLESFLLPFWKENYRLGVVNPTDDVLLVDTTNRRFKDKALVMDFNEEYRVVDILSMDSSSITLTEQIGKAFSNAVVVPLGYFKMSSPLDITKGSEDYYKAKARFISTDDYTYSGSITFPLYLGEYVVTDRPIVQSGIPEKFEREFSVIDNISGNLVYTADFDYPIATSEMLWSNINPEELYEVRYFLSEMKGKQGQFWIPSWNKDFVLDANVLAADDFMLVKDNGIRNIQTVFHIAIILKTGTIYFNKVTDITSQSGSERLAITPLGVDLTPEEIDRISIMTLMRSDSDKINIRYLPSGHSEIKIPLMEVPHGL